MSDEHNKRVIAQALAITEFSVAAQSEIVMRDERKRLAKKADEERNKSPLVTCAASRHLHIMADELSEHGRYHMFAEEPEHCAASIYAVIASLWEARHQIQALIAERDKLLDFAIAIMRYWPEGDVDGGDLQDTAVKYGLLEPEHRTEPCAENGCKCREDYGFTEGDEWDCYRHTALLKGPPPPGVK